MQIVLDGPTVGRQRLLETVSYPRVPLGRETLGPGMLSLRSPSSPFTPVLTQYPGGAPGRASVGFASPDAHANLFHRIPIPALGPTLISAEDVMSYPTTNKSNNNGSTEYTESTHAKCFMGVVLRNPLNNLIKKVL